MERKILSLALVLALFLGISGGNVLAADDSAALLTADKGISLSGFEILKTHPIFNDVHDSEWYYDYVIYGYGTGLFNGVSANTFSPAGTMSRAMFATVVYRLCDSKGMVNDNTYDSDFNDVKTTDYYYKAVSWCYSYSIISGMGDGNFAPDSPVTRQEAATMLGRLIKVDEEDNIPRTNYSDVNSIADWAIDYVDVMTYYEIMSGNTDGTFKPTDSMTRAQGCKVASVLHQRFAYVEN